MASSRQSLGGWGEQAAVDYLEQHGYQILERNARTKYGEIDIIALHPSGEPGDAGSAINYLPVVVFVEVKTRQSRSLGPPEISVNERKKQHLHDSIQAYMQSNDDLPGNWRIDVIAVQRASTNSNFEIIHFENAFS